MRKENIEPSGILRSVARAAVSGVCLCCGLASYGDVFSDAYIYLRGMGEDKNADGFYDNGEFVNAVGNQTFHYTGLNHNLDRFAWKTETAFIPARNVVRTMTYLDMSHPVTTTEEGDTVLVSSFLRVAPASVPDPGRTGSHYAFYIRVKPSATQLSDDSRVSQKMTVLLNYASRWGEKGLMSYMWGAEDILYLSCGDKAGFNTKVRLSRGEWNDIVVAADDDEVRFIVHAGLTDAESKARYSEGSFSVTAGTPQGYPYTDNRLYIGGNDTVFWWPQTNAFDNGCAKVYSGGIQQFTMWTNSLSFAEMRKVINYPRTDLMRVGIENGSTDEFTGSGLETPAIDAEGMWKLPSEIASGESILIRFPLAGRETYTGHASAGTVYISCETNLNQVLRWKPTPDSADGSVTAVLNGRQLGEKSVSPSRTTYWNVPAECLASGTNVLSLTRSDSGAGALKLDALVLGGSVRLGWRNGSYNEFVLESCAYSRDTCLTSGDLRLTPRAFVGTGPNSESRFHVDVEDARLRQSGHRFEITVNPAAEEGADLEVLFNGESLGTRFAAHGGWTCLTWNVEPEMLLEKDNIITVRGPTAKWTTIDSVAWYMDRLSRGSVVVFR